MRNRKSTIIIAFALLIPGLCLADQITDWNRVATDVLLADTSIQNPGMASRTMAMMNLAMYDAVNGVAPVHQPRYSHGAAPSGASAEAAAIQAGFRVLSSIYPNQQAMLDAQRTASLSMIPEGPSKTDGIAYGDTVATNIVAIRSTDGFNNMVPYMTRGEIGHWEPDPLNPTQEVWGPEWGGIVPFALNSIDEMMVPPMPALTSQQYADAYNEVKLLGSRTGSTRTADQTEIAKFWAYDRLGMGTPMRMYNNIMRTVAENEGNSLSENARMFAMTATAIADAGIVAWDSKFEYDFWRPVSGIRQGGADGNPDTVPDENWEPLGAPGGIAPDGSVIPDFTPPFPTYLSGHASFGGALFASLENFFGTDDIAFDVTSDEVPGVTRSYSSFSQANEENGRSRVYLGIHWNFDDTMAREMGGNVADSIAASHFQTVPEPNTSCLLALGLLWMSRFRRVRR